MRLFDHLVWRRFYRLLRPFHMGDQWWPAFLMLATLIVLQLAMNGLNIYNSYNMNYYMTAIEKRQWEDFLVYISRFITVFGITSFAAGLYRFQEERLGVKWRKWTTEYLMNLYLRHQCYLKMDREGMLDNPDQRISEDVKTFSQITLSLFLIFFNSMIALISFSVVAWKITPLLVLAALVYAAFGSVLTILIGGKLVEVNNLQLSKEADLRYELVRVREHAESVALLQGETPERERLGGRLDNVVQNFIRMIYINRNLTFFTSIYTYLIPVIPVLVVAPLYFQGQIEFGVIAQAITVFGFVLNSFSVIINEFQRLTTFATIVHRLGSLQESLVLIADQSLTPKSLTLNTQADRLIYQNVTYYTPDGSRKLVENLNLDLPPGKRLLVVGSNGAGKTTLFRLTAGLGQCNKNTGQIERPSNVMFLPEYPYLVPGTLRDVLMYSIRRCTPSDEQILGTLQLITHEPLLLAATTLDGTVRDWSSILSLGEQQALAFARVLISCPQWVFMDEALSAVSAKRVKWLYDRLWDSHICYITFSENMDLLAYHDVVLQINGNGLWTVQHVSEMQTDLPSPAAQLTPVL